MNELQIFKNPEFGSVRTVTINDEPWLVGKDVAEVLGYSDTNHAILDHVDDEDRTEVNTLEENKQLICDLLLPALQATRNLYDLVKLEFAYRGEDYETVTATFANGSTKIANVSMDSGTAMILDIVRQVV